MHSEPKISSSEKNSLLNIRRIIFFTSIILIILIIALITVLYTTIDHSNTTSSKECLPGLLGNLAIINDGKCDIGVAIERLGFAIGGIIALLVALASFQRARALDDTAKAQEQGNIEDRYNNAITQFGNANSSVRLAGAYGLYHLAIDNEDRRRNICDLLCVHIRTLTTSKAPILNSKCYSETYEAKPSDEVQSILDLLTNKNNKKNFPFKSYWINLANAYLNGANLWGAQLQGANLYKAQFKEADLNQANLENARLQGANFKNAKNLKTVQILKAKDLNLESICLAGLNLSKGNFSNFNLSNAQLQGANLSNAQLQGANLSSAQLQVAHLESAQLQGANLERAQLQGAYLSSAQLQGAYLSSAQFQGADLRSAQFQAADLRSAQFQAADLGSAQLQGAYLESAQFQGADLRSAQLQAAYLGKVQLQMADLRSACFEVANLSQAQLQEAKLKATNFRGTITQKKYIYSNTYSIINEAIELLKFKKLQKDRGNYIYSAVFSGGVTEEQLESFKQRTTETIEELAKIKDYDQNKINTFKQKMIDVENILEEHKGKDADYNFPSEYDKTIKKGIYPEAEVNKIIEMLEKVKKEFKK